jgi:uncharacterized protein (TIGR02301 family)
MRRRLVVCLVATLATLSQGGPLRAQESASPAQASPTQDGQPGDAADGPTDRLAPSTAAPAPPAPYEGPLLRLSELMGALHYLRGLCRAPDAEMWRQRMTALIESESGDEGRKSRLAGAFNRGYRTYQQTYHSCNASAQATITAYVSEGQKITRDIGTRFAD